jgi:hypothetical protein
VKILGEIMSVRAKAMFIVGWIVFIIAALLKMTHDALKVHTLTEEKFWLILMVTLFFAAFVLLAIVLILRRFGHSAGEIKNLHKFIAKAMEVEGAKSKNRKYLTTIESREYDLGYFSPRSNLFGYPFLRHIFVACNRKRPCFFRNVA